MRPIDADALLKEYDRVHVGPPGGARKLIEDAPTVGEDLSRWIRISPAKIYECEKCGQNVMTNDIEAYKYCHGCGRKMLWNR